MKKAVLFSFALLVFSFISLNALAANTVRIDVVYMNHGPLQPTLGQMKNLFAQYSNKVAVFWHDVESDDGEKFMAKKGIRGHIPLVVWLDDKVKFQVDGKEIIFAGFPTGSGPSFFQGKWKMDDLKKALNQVTNKK